MMNSLQQCFPMIRTREEIFSKIYENEKLAKYFYSWGEEQRKRFLSFCTNEKNIRILYGFFCKEILNPVTRPERLEDLLSLLLRRKIHILYSFSADPVYLTEKAPATLLGGGIVAEVEGEGNIAIELHKLDEDVPLGQCACCSASMLLRQYRTMKDIGEKNAPCINISGFYTIVLFEKSPAAFHELGEIYIHRFEQRSDSGLKLGLLQKYIFISLDIFKKNCHNKPIRDRLEAWLTFLSEESMERIAALVAAYPEFRFIYRDMHHIYQNLESLMDLYAESLRLADRSTMQVLFDDMQDKIERLHMELAMQKNKEAALDAEFKRLCLLYKLLARERRTDDMIMAAMDEDYCRKLYREFKI